MTSTPEGDLPVGIDDEYDDDFIAERIRPLVVPPEVLPRDAVPRWGKAIRMTEAVWQNAHAHPQRLLHGWDPNQVAQFIYGSFRGASPHELDTTEAVAIHARLALQFDDASRNGAEVAFVPHGADALRAIQAYVADRPTLTVHFLGSESTVAGQTMTWGALDVFHSWSIYPIEKLGRVPMAVQIGNAYANVVKETPRFVIVVVVPAGTEPSTLEMAGLASLKAQRCSQTWAPVASLDVIVYGGDSESVASELGSSGFSTSSSAKVSVSGTHGAVVSPEGAVVTWGRDYLGALGREFPSSSPEPPGPAYGIPELVTAVRCGQAFTAAIGGSGSVYIAGRVTDRAAELGTKRDTDDLGEVADYTLGFVEIPSVAGQSFESLITAGILPSKYEDW